MPNYQEIFIQAFLGIAGVPIVIALVQLIKESIKNFGKKNNLIAVGIGIIIQVAGLWTFDMLTKQNVISAIFVGIMIGLMASGLYTYKKVQ